MNKAAQGTKTWREAMGLGKDPKVSAHYGTVMSKLHPNLISSETPSPTFQGLQTGMVRQPEIKSLPIWDLERWKQAVDIAIRKGTWEGHQSWAILNLGGQNLCEYSSQQGLKTEKGTHTQKLFYFYLPAVIGGCWNLRMENH